MPSPAAVPTPVIGPNGEKIYHLHDMCDTHVHIIGDRAYAYTGHDSDPKARRYIMPDWRVFSSDDLVHWKLERVIQPGETYLGAGATNCWATDAATRHGKYYFYFCEGKISSGVTVADAPAAFKDALGKPLILKGLTPSECEHDPTIFFEDDAKHTPYIVFGASSETPYHIARLNEDMISLAEEPRPIGSAGWKSDQNYLFKRNGIYYLSFNTNRYVTSRNLYGRRLHRAPPRRRGRQTPRHLPPPPPHPPLARPHQLRPFRALPRRRAAAGPHSRLPHARRRRHHLDWIKFGDPTPAPTPTPKAAMGRIGASPPGPSGCLLDSTASRGASAWRGRTDGGERADAGRGGCIAVCVAWTGDLWPSEGSPCLTPPAHDQ